ncbi:MAG: winged helix DNA-binding domain-containing protein [Actinomycetota bacterium]|nr:winged helix DNA-binding domain-containing protein [Actinomycetota bacterium]
MAGRHDLLSVVDQSVGVYGTAPTCYLSALARMPDFTLDEFNDAIAASTLVRVRAMRYSVHTFPVELLLVAAAATRRLNRKMNSYRKRLEGSYEQLAREVESALNDGPLPAARIRKRIDPENEIGDLFNVLLGMAAADNRIVRATTTGSWRSDRFLYARWQDWLPGTDPNEIDTDDAMRELVARYVAAYGPVDVEDVRWWTGWTRTETLQAIDGIDLGAVGTAADLLTGVRLLPVWDVWLVAYRNRDRLLDPGHAPLIYDRFGNATSAVLDRGRIVGQWDLGSSDDPLEIRVAPFSKWPKRRWSDVEIQAQRIGNLIGAESVTVVPVDEPTDLLDSSRNRFLSPLSYR